MRLIIVAVALIFTVTSVQAQSVRFRGGVVTTGVTQACIDNGFNVRNLGLVRYNPRRQGSNGNDDRLSIFYSVYATNLTRRNRSFSKGFTNVNGTTVASSGFGYTAQFKVNISPSRIRPATNFLTMIGSVKNFGGISGCTLDFRAALTRRPS